MSGKTFVIIILILAAFTTPLHAAERCVGEERGSIITFWPFFDYRESPGQGFSNLSVLGPVFKLQHKGGTTDFALRPFFYHTGTEDSAETVILYPLASTSRWPDGKYFQVLKLFQKPTPAPGVEEKRGTMLFPFYISGKSEKFGPYVSVFPFYGDIYERFWRDEYHYVMFPLYSRTVKKGTESTNYLYPFFSLIRGERESGFQVWPLYGQAEKEGVYRRRFAAWPVYLQEETGLDTDDPTDKFYLFPFYTSAVSKKRVERHYLWPFFGYVSDSGRKLEERDYFWPFVVTIQGESRSLNRFLPLYSEDKRPNRVKRWYLWPLYSHEEMNSDTFSQERDRVLFFLYSDKRETWAIDGKGRRTTLLWPLFTYRSDERGIKTLTFPAPVEPVLDKDGIEKNWAPLWRLYVQKWNDEGDSAVSFLWNLYWHERRGSDLAYELFPFISYRSEKEGTDISLLKGFFRYQGSGSESRLSFLWLPFGLEWGKQAASGERSADSGARSGR